MVEPKMNVSQALEVALQMEIDGENYYRQAGQQSQSHLAKKLFIHLADEEKVHYQRAHDIYKKVGAGGRWPTVETRFTQHKSLRSVFREALDGMDPADRVAYSEIEAVKIAIAMEDQSYSYYNSRSKEAASSIERAFYEELSAEEQQHRLALVDTYDYLSDPQGWLTKQEHWSLDGG